MFRLAKFIGFAFIGMLLAPKKGIELRIDFVNYLKKYRPQIKKFISALDEAWEKTQSNESDEVVASIEMKLDKLKEASDELDSAQTKELAYKILLKMGQTTMKIGKEMKNSKNMQSIAKDLALITVDVIDKADQVYSEVKDVSASMSEDVAVIGDSKKDSKKNEEQ
ncbi:hypothetical protein SGLAD_v1c08750 [Spiroplasma gladiatoris]|uniref:Uncharacterized protein n=1 Tax=Spiroplasma gladiatoris TaxID=2143 RepID=A0A4P7AI00_9MOLU|nr:hypothetical protein [Spiroplasma gladiatoris]QBQ08074.1 hypothetical protein SGLAD_v1c08750 [Spiroplasma gladiatoris]